MRTVFHTTLYTLFLYNHSATTNLYTLSLHDALPISLVEQVRQKIELRRRFEAAAAAICKINLRRSLKTDRKSTRLNSSHITISYAVFCLKKKIKIQK